MSDTLNRKDAEEYSVSALARLTGYSRPTVYRYLKDGKTKQEILDSSKIAVAESSEDLAEDQASLTWCKAVLWAAEHMNEKTMTLKKAGNKLRLSMWQSTQEYPKELLIQLVPKALQILDRNKGSEETVEMVRAEEKAVDEMLDLLKVALVDAAKVDTRADQAWRNNT